MPGVVGDRVRGRRGCRCAGVARMIAYPSEAHQAKARGVDVSHWHPIKDAAAMVASGVTFAGVKATEGRSYTDPAFFENASALRSLPAADLDLMIYYHFARSGDARAQAHHLCDVVGEMGPRERLCLDLEHLVAPPARMLAWLDDFYEVVLEHEVHAQRSLIYTSRRIWRLFEDPAWQLAQEAQIDLWAPRYNNVGLEPSLPAPWAQWSFWQWTDGGEHGPSYSCPGIGPCDANIFNGGRADLQKWVAGF